MSYVCDTIERPVTAHKVLDDIVLEDFRTLLNEYQKYIFIICIEDKEDRNCAQKLLRYYGVKDYGTAVEGFSKDFSRRKKIQQAFYDSLNEVFDEIDITKKTAFTNLRRSAILGAGYWDILLLWIYSKYKNKKNTSYLEVGPGLGTMGLTLKKIMEIDETWLTIPNEEVLWSDWKTPSSTKLIQEKYNIKIVEGFIETDHFDGKYDVIVISQVMEHLLYNPVNTFSKLREMLTEDGRIFVCVPQEKKRYYVESPKDIPFPSEMTPERKNALDDIFEFHHFYEYNYEEAKDVFERSGLECEDHVKSNPIHLFMLKKKA